MEMILPSACELSTGVVVFLCLMGTFEVEPSIKREQYPPTHTYIDKHTGIHIERHTHICAHMLHTHMLHTHIYDIIHINIPHTHTYVLHTYTCYTHTSHII